MPFPRKALLFKDILTLPCALYITFLLSFSFNYTTVFSVITGLVVYIIFSYLSSYLQPLLQKELNRSLLVFSVSLSALIVFAIPGKFIPSSINNNYVLLTVKALGQKNDSAKGSEIWIPHIYNNGIEYDSNNISLGKGWEKKDGAILSYRNQPAVLNIRLKDPVSPRLVFVTHPWSGKMEIQEGQKVTTVDLYKNCDPWEFYTYNVGPSVSDKRFSKTEKAILSIISILALSVLAFIFLAIAKRRNSWHVVIFFLGILIFYLPDYLVLGKFEKFLCLLGATFSCIVLQKPEGKIFVQQIFKRHYWIYFVIALLIAGFALIGSRLFLVDYPVKSGISKIAYLLLFDVWLSVLLAAFLYLTDSCKRRISAIIRPGRE